jgi:hypothetical protein
VQPPQRRRQRRLAAASVTAGFHVEASLAALGLHGLAELEAQVADGLAASLTDGTLSAALADACRCALAALRVEVTAVARPTPSPSPAPSGNGSSSGGGAPSWSAASAGLAVGGSAAVLVCCAVAWVRWRRDGRGKGGANNGDRLLGFSGSGGSEYFDFGGNVFSEVRNDGARSSNGGGGGGGEAAATFLGRAFRGGSRNTGGALGGSFRSDFGDFSDFGDSSGGATVGRDKRGHRSAARGPWGAVAARGEAAAVELQGLTATSATPQLRALEAFLGSDGLAAFAPAFLAFGAESVADLCDPALASDAELVGAVGLRKVEVRKFRRLVEAAAQQPQRDMAAADGKTADGKTADGGKATDGGAAASAVAGLLMCEGAGPGKSSSISTSSSGSSGKASVGVKLVGMSTKAKGGYVPPTLADDDDNDEDEEVAGVSV